MDAADVWGEQIENAKRIVLVVKEHVGGVEVHLEVGRFQIVKRPAQERSRFLPGLEGDDDTRLAGQISDLRERVEERLAFRRADFRNETGVQHDVRQPELTACGRAPLNRSIRSGRVAGSPKPPDFSIVCGEV